MKTNIIIISVVLGISLAVMPADSVPYFLVMLAIVAAVSPLAVAVAVPVHFIHMRRAKRKASKEFARAYDAWKRATRDPYTLDAHGCESGLFLALENLKSLKP